MLTLGFIFVSFCSGRRAAAHHAIFFRGKDYLVERKSRSWWAFLCGLQCMMRVAQVFCCFHNVRFHVLFVFDSDAVLF
jgi:hypothetical protein